MKIKKTRNTPAHPMLAAACFLGAGMLLLSCSAAEAIDMDFDWQGQAIFKSYDLTPDNYMAGDSGDRNLNSYYALRQYPGSPPRIPHNVEPSFADEQQDCLSCHAKGGFSPADNGFIPVTPHPEKEMCNQCHVPLPEQEKYFVLHDWKSINPPRLGRSALGGSPPTIPHTLQLRENCITCHTGPGAVVEIRVEHSARGNCRQCHVPLVSTEPVKEFTRTSR
jgi:cytochrome c-type protein NapB